MTLWLDDQRICGLTKRLPRAALASLLRYCGGELPTRKHLLGWMASWPGAGSTMQVYASAMRRFFAYLGGEELYPDIGHGLRNYSRMAVEHSHLPLSEAEVARLLEHLSQFSQPDQRDLTVILLMLSTGLRCCEVVRARVCDLYQHDGKWCLRVQGKGHVYPDAYVEISDYLHDQLCRYMALSGRRESTETIMRGHGWTALKPLSSHRLTMIVRVHLDAIGLHTPRYTAHSLRHTAATLALERGATEEQVSKMLRHVDPRTTRIYTQYVDRMAHPAEQFLDFRVPDAGTPSKVVPLRRA